MISKAKTVNDYLKEVPAERKKALSEIRKLCKEILIGWDETMLYGGPCYHKPGHKHPAMGFGSQKHYIGFYCLIHEVMLANKKLLKDLDHGKGVIRFHPGKVNLQLIGKLLEETAASTYEPC